MKKIATVLIFLMLFPVLSRSQYRWDLGGGIGIANYLGDIGGKENTRRDFISDLKLAKTRFNLSGFARMRFYTNKKLYLKTEFSYLMIEGADKLSSNAGRKYRNLNFRNNIFELSSTLQYVVFEDLHMGRLYRKPNHFRIYVFGGLGVFHHAPKGNYNGEWVALRPLMTEGQKKPYSPFGICVPVGAGFSFTIKKRHRFSWEFNWRTTFTDYLDDISTNYAAPNSLSSPLAVAMSNRTNAALANDYQSGFSGNFVPGKKRGDPTHNDSYLTATFSYSYVFRGSSARGRALWWKHFKNTGRLNFWDAGKW